MEAWEDVNAYAGKKAFFFPAFFRVSPSVNKLRRFSG
jgi:hypothetical protein